jgi:hypothetical protein
MTILDSLLNKDIDIQSLEEEEEEELVIPQKCYICKNQLICSVLTTFVAMSRLKIIVSVEECPYHGKLD